MATRIETRELLADSYIGGVARQPSMLTHAVEVAASGQPIRVLCGGVKLDNVADRDAEVQHTAPTCKRCFKRRSR